MNRRNIILASLFILSITLAVIASQYGMKKEETANKKVSEVSLLEALIRTVTVEGDRNFEKRVTLSEDFSKDENAVYWLGSYIVMNADVNSFQIYDNEYARDSQRVYFNGYVEGGSTRKLYQILGADVSTFESLGNGYARDKNHAYFRGNDIAGADAASFAGVDQPFVYYAKDKNSAYSGADRLSNFNASTFRVYEGSSPGGMYLLDDQRVWLHTWFSDSDAYEMREIVSADPDTFKVLKGVWAIDKNQAFYGTHPIEGVDLKTYEVFGKDDGDPRLMMYAKDESNVYYTFNKVASADAKTFQPVENVWIFPANYGEDEKSAYRNGEIFPKNDLLFFKRGQLPPSVKDLGSRYFRYDGAIYHYPVSVQAAESMDLMVDVDPDTFRILKNGYARDDKRVYYQGEMIVEDPLNTFEILRGSYSKDAESIYYGSKKIDGADPSTFSFIRNSDFTMDKNSVYFYENFNVRKIESADPATFQVVLGSAGNYGRDDRHVFIGDHVLESAIPQSFRYLDVEYSKDSESVYFGEKKINNVDPVSFKVFGSGLSTERGYHDSVVYYSYAKDKEHVFCEADILSGADIKTFILKGKNGMPQDKFHRYNWCETIE